MSTNPKKGPIYMIWAYNLNDSQLSILYEPDTGDYNARQNLAQNNDTEAFNVYNTLDDFTLSPIDETDVNKPVNTKPTPKPKSLDFTINVLGDDVEILYSDIHFRTDYLSLKTIGCDEKM